MRVYIVTSGCYSDYGIERVFLSKEKAEKYVNALDVNYHDGIRIEEFDTSDDVEFEEYRYVYINYYKFTPYKEDNLFEKEQVSFNIVKTNSLDHNLNSLRVNRLLSYNDLKIELYIKRPIFGDYDEDYLKDKYTKVCQDLSIQIKHLIEVEGWTKDMVNAWLDNAVDEKIESK